MTSYSSLILHPSSFPPHPHPCHFRKHRHQDRGWGELAVEYRWDSTSGRKTADGLANPDLEHCFLYEITHYTGNVGTYAEGYFLPPNPPFADWKFRDPTDGRSGPVGCERFEASQGWAWDRHKLGGRLIVPPTLDGYEIYAVQQYWFCCELCGTEMPVPGPESGPHTILRRFQRIPYNEETGSVAANCPLWRYSLHKHDLFVLMDIDCNGYIADSAGIGFGPR